MEDSKLYTCQVNFLSLGRAEELVPPEFIRAYRWFQEHAGQHLDRLPMGRGQVAGFPLSLARQSGIHSPDYRSLPSRGEGKPKYALSIHSEGQRYYEDRDVIEREDGTWILDYCAHRTVPGKRPQTNYNEAMMNCLRDGVPVAVMVKESGGGYRNLGLAFIEEYNAETDIFILHGPVTAENEREGFFSFIQPQLLGPEDRRLLEEWDLFDERAHALVEQVRRERQGIFHRMVAEAYGGACAVTEISVPEVLQAAHIDRYRGGKSQVVTNGILLRMDIHRLYDEHLLSVDPDGAVLRISDRLSMTPYARYDGHPLNLPRDPSLRPDGRLLEMHYRQFVDAARVS